MEVEVAQSGQHLLETRDVAEVARQRDLAGEAAEVVAVPGAVGAGAGLVGHRLRQAVQQLDDLLLVLGLVEQLGQLLELGHVVLEQRAALPEQVGDDHGQVGDVAQRAADGVAVAGQVRHPPLELGDQGVELPVPLVDRGEGGRQVGDDLPDELVPVGEGVGQRRGVGQQLLHGAALALEDLHQVEAEVVDLLGGQRLEQRLEPVEQRGEVERGRGLADREGGPVLKRGPGAGGLHARGVPADPHIESVGPGLPLRVPGLEGQVAVADQVEEADLGTRGGRDRDVGADPEGHQRLVPLVVLHLPDLADAHAGDPHVVALLEHRGAGEDRPVVGAGAEAEVAHDHRQQAGHEDRDDGEDQQLDAGGQGRGVAAVADPDRLALGGSALGCSRLLLTGAGRHEPAPPLTTGP